MSRSEGRPANTLNFMKKMIPVCCIVLMILAGLYVKGKANTPSLIIDEDGTLTGVIDKRKLKGKLALPGEAKKIGKGSLSGCTGLTAVDLSACTSAYL